MPYKLTDQSKEKTDVTAYHMAQHPFKTIRNRYREVHQGGAQQYSPASGQGDEVGEALQKDKEDHSNQPSYVNKSHPGSAPRQLSDPDRSRAEAVTSDFVGRSTSARTVRDPVTHSLLEHVRDVTKEEYQGGLAEAEEIGSYVPRSGEKKTEREQKHTTGQTEKEKGENQGIYRGTRSGTSAIPAFPFHDPLRPRYQAAVDSVAPRIRKTVVVVLSFWIAGIACLAPSFKTAGISLLTASLLGVLLPHLIQRRVQDALEDADAQGEEQRGEKIAKSHWPESAEWANKILGEIWPALEPDFFDSLRDTLEDILQANLPSFLTECKVADFNQGANPLRILSATLLPDTEWNEHEVHSGDASSSEPDAKGDTPEDELSREIKAANKENERETNPEEAMLREQHDPNDRYVNLSISFAYRGRQKKEKKQFGMAEDVQMLLYLMAKLGPVAVRLPVKVHLKGLVGTVRLRVHLIASPPFLGQTLISFTSLPRLTIDVLPLKLISLNDFKPLADFIQNSIDSSLAAITAPKSMMLDLADLISSDGVQRKILALGIVVVTICRAEGIERADLLGSSDCYAIVSWSKSGKPMYSTRVLLKELNPRFNESVALLVPPEVVKAGERVGVELYDSDVGQDDFLGVVGIELSELMRKPGVEVKRYEQLGGVRPGTKRGGMVEWSARFLPKVPLEKESTAREDPQKKGSPASKNDESHFQDDRAKDQKCSTPNAKQPPIEYIPPSPRHPSGILSVQVHEISALSNKSSLAPLGSTARLSRRTPISGRPIPDEDTMDEQARDEAPSSYVEVIIEDKLVYRTRTKISDYRPIFNARTEKVVLNFTTARVLLVVKEKKLDEDDPILGVVPIKLSDVFKDKSVSAGWYPIAGGAGSGRIKVSMLFRSVGERQRDKSQGSVVSRGLGLPISPLEIGVLHIRDIQINIEAAVASHYSYCTLAIKTLSSNGRLSSRRSKLQGSTLSYSDRLSTRPIRLPVFRRCSSPLILRLDSKSSLGRKKTRAMGVCWLRDLPDGKIIDVELPLWDGEEDKKVVPWLSQQYSKIDPAEQEEDVKSHCPRSTTRKGSLRIRLGFVMGLSSLHEKIRDPSGRLGHVCQAWKLALSKGLVFESSPEGEEKEGGQSGASDSGGGGGGGGGGMKSARSDRHDSSSSSSSSSSSEEEDEEEEEEGEAKASNARISHKFHSSGSPLDLVRRSQRQLVSGVTGRMAGGREDDDDGSGSTKAVRVLDGAVGQVRGKAHRFVNRLDVKRSQKGGEGVEMEV